MTPHTHNARSSHNRAISPQSHVIKTTATATIPPKALSISASGGWHYMTDGLLWQWLKAWWKGVTHSAGQLDKRRQWIVGRLSKGNTKDTRAHHVQTTRSVVLNCQNPNLCHHPSETIDASFFLTSFTGTRTHTHPYIPRARTSKALDPSEGSHSLDCNGHAVLMGSWREEN